MRPRAITWRILCIMFYSGLFAVPLTEHDISRVRHNLFARGGARMRARVGMIEQILGSSSSHGLKLFSVDEIAWLEDRVFQRQTKRGKEYAVNCIVREKDIKLTPEEVVRQLYAHRLMDEYGYPVSRLAFEFPVFFGRETKRADIVVRDKDDQIGRASCRERV